MDEFPFDVESSSSEPPTPTTSRLIQLAEEIGQFTFEDLSMDDGDSTSAYTGALRGLAKRFATTAKWAGDPVLSEMVAGLNTSPEFIEEAFDLKAELIPIINYVKDPTQAPTLRLTPLVDEIEQFSFEGLSMDDGDSTHSYTCGFRSLAKTFVATAKRVSDSRLSSMIAELDTSPESIEEAFDLHSELMAIVDYLREAMQNPGFGKEVEEPQEEEAPEQVSDEAPIEPVDPNVPHLVYEGDFWKVSFGGSTMRYRDTLGLWYIKYLIKRQNGMLHALPLYAVVANLRRGLKDTAQPRTMGDHMPGPKEYSPLAAAGFEPEDAVSENLGQTIGTSLGDGGEDTDRKTLLDLRKRIKEIDEILEDNDVREFEEDRNALEDEKEFLMDYIRSTTAIGGRIRRSSGNPGEKARNSVRNAVRRVLKKFETEQPGLCRHLAPPTGKLHLGYVLWYGEPGYVISLIEPPERQDRHEGQ
jgi:hypothetical protein